MPASRVQSAVFEYIKNPRLSIVAAAAAHDLNPSTLHRIYTCWMLSNVGVNPCTPSDVVIQEKPAGRLRSFSDDEEDLIAGTTLQYALDGWKLTVTLVLQVAEHYLQRHCPAARPKMFKNGVPSRGWVENYISRRLDLRKIALRFIDDQHLAAVSRQVVAEHIAFVKAVLDRYRIREPSHIVNLDEVGVSFDRMTSRSLRRGVVHASQSRKVAVPAMRTRGKLNHVTLLAVVAADGRAFTPAVVFPGKQPHYLRLSSGRLQTVHDFLPPCYLYHRDPAGVDSSIFLDWAHKFLEETEELLSGDRHMLVICDGFSGHIQLAVLSLLQANRVHVVALPSHSSHVLQPLDVTVFSPFKSTIQAELHKMCRHTRCIDVFGAAFCIARAYDASVTYSNIVSGFEETGIWVRSVGGPSGAPLTKLFEEHGKRITVAELMRSFDKSTRGRVFSADVVENSTVGINTSTGAHLPCDAVIGALALRERRRDNAGAPQGPSPFVRRGLMTPANRRNEQDVDQSLAPVRRERRDALDRSRFVRRTIRKRRTTAARSLV